MNDTKLKRAGRIAKTLKWVGISITGIFAVTLVAHIAWINSGSNEWREVSFNDGIRVSVLKTPGYSLFKYKVNMHVESSLSDVVSFLTETNTGNDVGAFDIRRIEEVATVPIFYAYDTYKINMPPPFGEIEVLIINQYHQDPESKKVTVNVNAAPNKIPLNKSISRIVHLSNTWTLTPLKTGGVDIMSVSEMDLGLPYVLANMVMPDVIDKESNKIRELLKKDKYKNKKPLFISELRDDRKIADVQL